MGCGYYDFTHLQIGKLKARNVKKEVIPKPKVTSVLRRKLKGYSPMAVLNALLFSVSDAPSFFSWLQPLGKSVHKSHLFLPSPNDGVRSRWKCPFPASSSGLEWDVFSLRVIICFAALKSISSQSHSPLLLNSWRSMQVREQNPVEMQLPQPGAGLHKLFLLGHGFSGFRSCPLVMLLILRNTRPQRAFWHFALFI